MPRRDKKQMIFAGAVGALMGVAIVSTLWPAVVHHTPQSSPELAVIDAAERGRKGA